MRETAILSRRALAAALPIAALAGAGTMAAGASTADSVLAQIELHKALVIRVNTAPDDDEDPAFQAACAAEEAAIQALGDMTPMTVAAAALNCSTWRRWRAPSPPAGRRCCRPC